ncbi:3'-5' exoribonuclease [Rhodococcus sp. T2V]|uniref:3'-5' exoribonuclease domain-containing protein n=1 Tax=Rhodococcus sp. T2V TaxID=3034164 RepID=UPI0023E225DD|nr:3'-5' exoribonuclease [Rhodococcus sp. T2V]MDF3308738.1 3'-5' exoribonuclease [Rhodococcus sp. T2V]
MPVRYFYDTEFLEDGSTIELISIGIVSNDGREYYAVNADMPVDRIKKNDWILNNVWPQLPLRGYRSELVSVGGSIQRKTTVPGSLDTTSTLVRPRWVIRNEVRDFILGDPKSEELPAIELWADFGDYDHVVLAQLFGPMIRLPEGIPMFTRDLQQRLSELGHPRVPVQDTGLHHALDDARHVKAVFDYLEAGEQA